MNPLSVINTTVPSDAPKKIGTFSNIVHGIAGTAYAMNSSTILIKGFKYDGECPDAFFLGGTKGQPSKDGWPLPYPFEGQFYKYVAPDIPILGK